MSRTLDKDNKRTKKDPGPKAVEAPARPKETYRDFVEQIVVAFILAFLVRGFEAEAFVIPTGSMAPTLMGMHKEVTCPHCGFEFTVNASDEFEPRPGQFRPVSQIVAGTCGNCRAPVRLDEDASFNGDRILVMKFLYSLPIFSGGEPNRWEVVVFHYPEQPEVNYIKRLVGLPGEELRIYFGDILTRPIGSDKPFQLQHKPLKHQESMQMMVWDDRYRPREFADRPEWQRWQPQTAGAWSEPTAGTFVAKASSGWSELRYRNLVPDTEQWESLLVGEPMPYPPRASLISDFYAYNSGSPYVRQVSDWNSPHWVGDLTLSCRVTSSADSGQIRLELVEGGVPNRCVIELSTGEARLYHGDTPVGKPASTVMKGKGTHDLQFANVDGRLTLWVDGQTPFGEGVVYDDGTSAHLVPTEADLSPVGVAANGADVAVSDLVLKRDIYYTLYPGAWDYDGLGFSRNTDLSNPSEFSLLAELKWKDFVIKPHHYMMLGDNSPRSKDGRGWGLEDRDWDEGDRSYWEVPESLLIGKAFFVYWPHGKPFWPNFQINRNFRLPFRPYLERMKWIR